MSAGPWERSGFWGRYIGSDLVAHIGDHPDGRCDAWYCAPGKPWSRRGCDDLTSAARTCNAGLRLLGLNCDDTLPEPTDG